MSLQIAVERFEAERDVGVLAVAIRSFDADKRGAVGDQAQAQAVQVGQGVNLAFRGRDSCEAGDHAMKQPAIDWNAAFAQHRSWLRTVVLARVREPQAVDDVMQEVALAAIKQQAPLADAAKLAPWLYRLAVLQALL